MSKVAKISDTTSNPELDECKKLDEMFDKKITISGFHTIQVGANECAIIDTDLGKLSSFSKVIIDQLGKMKPDFDAKNVFKAKATKKKNYYMLVDA